MSFEEFVKLMGKVAKAIESRQISLPPQKAKLYEAGAYNPQFSLIDREGELICIWCSNIKDGDKEIVRIGNVAKGLKSDMNDPAGWDKVTTKVMNYYGLKL